MIGSRDPNPKVSGKGAKILREAGVRVEEDFLREECDALNPVFFHYITTGLPYVVMKYAMTADGKIATKTGASKWISGEEARSLVHEMRHDYMAIMAGIGTVLADDPMLNVRLEGKKSPVRIICDSMFRREKTQSGKAWSRASQRSFGKRGDQFAASDEKAWRAGN